MVGELVAAEFKRLETTWELEANAVVSINKVPKSKEIEYLPAGGGRLRGFLQCRDKGLLPEMLCKTKGGWLLEATANETRSLHFSIE